MSDLDPKEVVQRGMFEFQCHLQGMTSLERFWAQTMPEPNSGCWLWLGSLGGNKLLYGVIQIGSKTKRAHRFSYATFVAPIPDGMFVLHRCDNPVCVNPDHLFLGTLRENSEDRGRKGRTARGPKHGQAKLTESIVRAMRISNLPRKVLAAQYGVNVRTAASAISGQTWGHVK